MKPHLSLQFADKAQREQLPHHQVARWLRAAPDGDAEKAPP